MKCKIKNNNNEVKCNERLKHFDFKNFKRNKNQINGVKFQSNIQDYSKKHSIYLLNILKHDIKLYKYMKYR